MFTYQRPVYLKDTDATGVIYFASLFQYALEAFEAFLKHKDYSLLKFFEEGYLMPVVHAEADYKAPLRVGDLMAIHLSLSHVGVKSFSIQSNIYRLPDEVLAGSCKIVHAFMRKGEISSSEIPEKWLALFNC